MKACARCKKARYCSRECQIADWKNHRSVCNRAIEHFEELARADALLERHRNHLSSGPTLVELSQKLGKWVKVYSNLLMAATIHALSLPKDIKRAHLYMLRVKVSYRSDNNGTIAKAFRVDDAFIIDLKTARALGGVWLDAVNRIQRLREESEASRNGTVTAVGLECFPLPMQVVPFGSLQDLSYLIVQQRWKEILIKNVENGTKFTRFEMTE